MTETQECACGLGEMEEKHGTNSVKFLWHVHESYVSEFVQITSPWACSMGEEFRLFKLIHEGHIYLGVMTRNPSKMTRLVKTGLNTEELQEKFCVTRVLPESSCFLKNKVCLLSDITREFVNAGCVTFSCEIRQHLVECLLENTNENGTADKGTSTLEAKENVGGTPEYMGARLKDMDDTKPKEAYIEDDVAAGTSTLEAKENVGGGTSGDSTGARPKAVHTSPKEINGTAHTAGSENGRSARSIRRAEEAGAVRNSRNRPVVIYNGAPGRNLVRDMTKLLEVGYGADIIFILKDGRCRGHSVILYARLPYFSSMMNDMVNGTITYPDCTERGFRVFLLHKYTDRLDDLTASNVFEVFYIARKFGDEGLIIECLDRMKNCIDFNTFIPVLELLLEYDNEELRKAAFRFFVKNKDVIIQAIGFESFQDEHPDVLCKLFVEELIG